jgi:hypothetical protein
MLVAAIAVGLLATYYFGLRPGVVAAAATAGLLLLALVVPPLSLYAYVAVGLGVAGLVTIGPRVRRKGSPAQLAGFARLGLLQLRRMVRQFGGGKPGDKAGDRPRRKPGDR